MPSSEVLMRINWDDSYTLLNMMPQPISEHFYKYFCSKSDELIVWSNKKPPTCVTTCYGIKMHMDPVGETSVSHLPLFFPTQWSAYS